MKVTMTITIEEEDKGKLQHFCKLTGYPMSKLFEDHIKVLVRTYDLMGVRGKPRLSKLDVLRLLGSGMITAK